MAGPISVQCSKCGAKLKLKNSKAVGKKVPCPKCKQQFVVKVRKPASKPEDELAGLDDFGSFEDESYDDDHGDDALGSSAMPPVVGGRSKSKKKQTASRGKKKGSRATKSESANWKLPAAIAGGVAGVLLLIGVVYLVVSSRGGAVANIDVDSLTDEQVIAEVTKLGGQISRELGLSEGPIISARFSNTAITDAELVYVKKWPKLRTLMLDGCSKFTDAGLDHVKGLAELETLVLRKTRVSDTGLVHLKGLAKLQHLYLDETQVTGAGLVYLKGFPQLQSLDLSASQITDAGLAHLTGLSSLQSLLLITTNVTDAGLLHLKGLSGLKRLNLSDTKVTDAGLEHLAGLSGLESLDLSRTKVTDAGVKQIQEALPDCLVTKF